MGANIKIAFGKCRRLCLSAHFWRATFHINQQEGTPNLEVCPVVAYGANRSEHAQMATAEFI